MFDDLPPYYKSSRIMKEVIRPLEAEYERLQEEVSLTENQFFVLLSDRDISLHEKDVGLQPDISSDINTRRGRVFSRLRGTSTVTKTMIKNVANSFVNGEIEIIEYTSDYAFAVKFISKKGVPYNIDDIRKVIEDIKPAHLAVEYIFTYRLWQDVKNILSDWQETKSYTWDGLLTFEVRKNITIADEKVYFSPDDNGNGIVVWNENKAYARKVE